MKLTATATASRWRPRVDKPSRVPPVRVSKRGWPSAPSWLPTSGRSSGTSRRPRSRSGSVIRTGRPTPASTPSMRELRNQARRELQEVEDCGRAGIAVDCHCHGDRRRRCQPDRLPAGGRRAGGLARRRLGRRSLLGHHSRLTGTSTSSSPGSASSRQRTLAAACFSHDTTATPGLPARLVLVDPTATHLDLRLVVLDRQATAGRTWAPTPGAPTRPRT